MRAFTIRVAVVLGAVAFGIVCTSSAADAQVTAMSGKSKVTFAKREVVPVGDVEGHIIAVTEARGVNENTGKSDFLNGAETASKSLVDLVKGNGTQNGYFTMSKDGTTAICKYSGTVRTTLSPEGKPVTSYSGEWKWVKCTGAYEGCTGQGVYQAASISENDILIEYRGIIAQ